MITYGLTSFYASKAESREKTMSVAVQVLDREAVVMDIPYIALAKSESGKKQIPGRLYKQCVNYLLDASQREKTIEL